MKKILFSIFAAVMAIGFVGCEYDDSEIVGRVDNLEQRVLTLEQLCQQMNTNISAMQAIVNALQTQDAITSVTPITEGNKTIGYTITFVKGDPITIYHGQDGKNGADGEDGKDGYTPVIGVDQDEDGVYYWTLDGEWLTDADGNKIPTSGKDGADGEDGEGGKAGMPELKIQGGYWYVSYDGGENWERLGRATGYDGQDGTNGTNGDSFFSSVTVGSDFVEFTLASNGRKYYVPRHVALEVNVKDFYSDMKITPGGEFLVKFELKNASDKVKYVVICDYDTDISDMDANKVVTVKGTVPANAQQGDEIKVTLLATDGGKSMMESHTFVVYASGVASVADFTAAVAAGGKITLTQSINGLSDLIKVEKDLTIDLNGQTLGFTPQSGYPGIKNTATLKIIDSKATGKITSTQVGIQNNGKLVINCDIESVENAINNVYDGETTINGGTYKNTSTEHALINSNNYDNGTPVLNINGGTFESVFTNVSYNNSSSGAVNAGTFICTGNWHNIYVGGETGGCNVTYNVSSCSFTDGTNAKIQVNNGVGLNGNTIARTNIVNGNTYTTTVNLLN